MNLAFAFMKCFILILLIVLSLIMEHGLSLGQIVFTPFKYQIAREVQLNLLLTLNFSLQNYLCVVSKLIK